MAESVFIEGFSDDVLAALPEWAKDATLEKILVTLNETLRLEKNSFAQLEVLLRKFTTGKSKPNDAVDHEKIAKLERDRLDVLLDAVPEETKQQKDKKKWHDQATKQHTAGSKAFGALTKKAIAFDLAMVAIDYVASKAIGVMAQNVEMFTNLYTAGIHVIDTTSTITDGFQSLANLSLLAGVRLTDMQRIFMKFGNTVNVYGTGKVVAATKAAQKNLSALGFSASESLEFTAAYLDSVKGFTNIQTMSTLEVAAATSKFGNTMRTMSFTTGQSVDGLMTKFSALAKSTDAMILNSQIGTGATTQMLGVLSGITDDSLRQSLLATMVAPVKEMDKTVTSLRNSGHAELAQEYMEFTRRLKGANPEEANNIIKSFGKNLKLTNADQEMLQYQMLSSNQVTAQAAAETLKIYNAYRQQSESMKELNAVEQANLDASNRSKAARDKVANAWNKIITSFGTIFAPLLIVVEKFGSLLEWVAGGMEELAIKLQGNWFGSIIVLVSTIMSVGGSIMAFGATIGLLSKGMGSLIGRIGLFILKFPLMIAKLPFTIVGALGRWLMGLFGKLFSVLNLKDALSKLNVGQWMADIFTKIGGWFSSIGTYIKGLLPRLWTVISSIFKGGSSFLTTILKSAGGWILRILGWFGKLIGKFAGPIGWLVTAFEAGYILGSYIYDMIKDFSWFQEGMDALFGWLDYILQYIPGQIGQDAKDRIETKEKVKAMEEQDAKDKSAKTQKTTETVNTAITAKAAEPLETEKPKTPVDKVEPVEPEKSKTTNAAINTPKPTAVSSVSSNTPSPAQEDSSTEAGVDGETIANTTPVSKEDEINSILRYQSILLERQLDKIVDLLAINRDQLKLARNA